ncbi:hypothetical protein CK203_000659 [Vitis vinifera]|uniref:Uncharacterized protein n=1 Tax=Vitis vinifera TaxID=29760 RepID=A0A438FBI0_VITVI|nr:hypothetical protein CK203_079284 [Vitis vinifera]RVX23226.1 hypothetical protein CK203_000659 [Vitis vinifera]
MRGYDRAEYYRSDEDLDEYEEEGEEADEDQYEEEEKEAPKPTKEEVEYLELRQKLKESFRKQLKKDTGSGHNIYQEKRKKLPYDKIAYVLSESIDADCNRSYCNDVFHHSQRMCILLV